MCNSDQRQTSKSQVSPILAWVVAANALLQADGIKVSLLKASPYGGGTPLCSSLAVQHRHHSMTCNLLWADIVYLILDKALRATVIVPYGSFDCFCFISLSRSSRNTTHFAVGRISASSPLPSHQACAVKFPCMTASKVWMRTQSISLRLYQPFPKCCAERVLLRVLL